MKFLLGYNMKIVASWGDENLVGGILPGGGILFKACANDGILVNFCN